MDLNEVKEIESQITIYTSPSGEVKVDILYNDDTFWLSQKRISELFGVEVNTINYHLKEIFKSSELIEVSVIRKFRITAEDGKKYMTQVYNLDVIIAVGYRVNSYKATQFRIWATQKLKDFLIKGYALNEKILSVQNNKLNQLNEAIKIISKVATSSNLDTKEKDSFLQLLEKYSDALNILDDYDYQRIKELNIRTTTSYHLTYDEVIKLIDEMKITMSNSTYFGKEKDESLKSSISVIYQTYDNIDLYPSIEEKATNLLYFLVKNHSFVDGNKRIAAALFLYFLEKNDILKNSNIDNDLLVALTLMIANSKSSDKNIIINIVTIILNKAK